MDTAESHLHAAGLALTQGRAHAALDEARAVLRTQPESGEAFAMIGLAWALMGDERESKAAVQRALDLAPRDAKVRYHCYLALGRLGDMLGARTQLTYLCQLQPGNVQARTALAKIGGAMLGLPPLPRAASAAIWYDGGGQATMDSSDIASLQEGGEPPPGPGVLDCTSCGKRTWKGWVCKHCGARLS